MSAAHTYSSNYYQSATTTDPALQPFVNLLNTPTIKDLLHSKWSIDSATGLMNAVLPWFNHSLAPFDHLKNANAAANTHVRHPPFLDCNQARYTTTLTGKPLKHTKDDSRIIVDFVPFAYDVDKLEVRFYELYHSVDAFVVYESPLTHSGIEKPLIFDYVRHTERFLKWQKKIIYLKGTVEELSEQREKVLLNYRNHEGSSMGSNRWALFWAMQAEIIRKFILLKETAMDDPLVKKIWSNIDRVYATQNDEDELPNGEAMFHIKHCELRPHVKAIYLPCFAFKSNFHWLQSNVENFIAKWEAKVPGAFWQRGSGFTEAAKGTNSNSSYHTEHTWSRQQLETERQLMGYLWGAGPLIWPLTDFLAATSTLRLATAFDRSVPANFTTYTDRIAQLSSHMGLGAAVHLSDVLDPGPAIMKRLSAAEENGGVEMNSRIQSLFKRSRNRIRGEFEYRNATPTTVMDHLLGAYCKTVHTSALKTTNPMAFEIVWQSIPWVIRWNPKRYPFMLPAPLVEDLLKEKEKESESIQQNGQDQNAVPVFSAANLRPLRASEVAQLMGHYYAGMVTSTSIGQVYWSSGSPYITHSGMPALTRECHWPWGPINQVKQALGVK